MYRGKRIAVIIAAAGSGTRMGSGVSKLYAALSGAPVLGLAVKAFAECPSVDDIYIVVKEGERQRCEAEIVRPYGAGKVRGLVNGGVERQESVSRALGAVCGPLAAGDDRAQPAGVRGAEAGDDRAQPAGVRGAEAGCSADCGGSGEAAVSRSVDWILVHDGARPFVTAALIDRVLEGLATHGAAIPGIPVKDTVKRAAGGLLTETVDRRNLFAIQTPQGFPAELLAEAYGKAAAEGFQGTDDAMLVERLGQAVHLVDGEERNIKITTPADLELGRLWLSGEGGSPATTGVEPAVACGTAGIRLPRAGLGFDAHAFADGRPLILGGVEIPFTRGLAGHSDADVLTHAVMDALLGACALGDIGRHFPDTDPQYKGISSLALLERTWTLVEAAGFSVGNIDVTLIGQKPKIAPFAAEMAGNLAKALGIAPEQVSVKGTTTEKMGFTGREEGLAAQAIAVVY